MNCCKCGKRLLAGVALCLTCEKDYKSVPDANTRLGYYARHPGALAALLMEASSVDLVSVVCQHDCVDDPDDEIENCTDENYAACLMRWLMAPVGEAPQDETQS